MTVTFDDAVAVPTFEIVIPDTVEELLALIGDPSPDDTIPADVVFFGRRLKLLGLRPRPFQRLHVHALRANCPGVTLLRAVYEPDRLVRVSDAAVEVLGKRLDWPHDEVPFFPHELRVGDQMILNITLRLTR